MLINAVTYTFSKECASEAEAFLRELMMESRLEPGCISYDVGRSIDDPSVFVLNEIWADQTALDNHYATDHFQRLGVHGIRTIATARVAILAIPLVG